MNFLIDSFPHALPLQGLLGGMLIGLAGAMMLLGLGRIAGVSGLAARALGLASGAPWFLAALFIVGLPAGALLVSSVLGGIEAEFPTSPWLLVIAGILTGFGTRLGSGCTSGHGVCGMSRLSLRSIVATLTFIGAGIATVAIVNALGGNW